MSDLTVVSLFDGIGGFLLAFQRAGAQLVASVEIDQAAAAVSHRHFPEVHQFEDVTEVTGDDLRAVGFVPERGIITAGWPCQDLSIAGRRAGLDGERSGLWWHVARLLDETRARWFVGENVPGLLSSNGGRDMGAVVGSLAELGYGISYRILDAQFFGVPQRRRRVFFVGHLGEPWPASAEVLFECQSSAGDFAEGRETGQEAAGSVAVGAGVVSRSGGGLVPTVSSKWSKGTGGPSGDECQNLVLEDTVSTLQGGAARVSDRRRIGGGRASHRCGAISVGGGKPGQGYQAVHNGTVVRRLTELECERLQGYPDNWTEGQTASARYRQLGNSVAVPCVEWIARRLIAVDKDITA